MRALERKLLRDLRRMWSQALTIALVVASGVGGFLTMLGAVDSLALARDRFYAEDRFADVFAAVKRAPDALADEIRALPGVAAAQTTIEQTVRIEIAGVSDPIIGQLIGLDPRRPPELNRPRLKSGRAPAASGDGDLEALVSEGFAVARGLRPGDRIGALVNGRHRGLRITGVAVSPEYIFAGFNGMPDESGFGVFWLDKDALAAAYDMHGAFNRIALRLSPGATVPAASAALDRLTAPYGGRDAHGRESQISHAMLDNEIKEMHVLGTVLPAIFLVVAAFLLNVVVSRLVTTQREQIAALKALGYSNRAVGGHYLALVLLIVAIGIALGTGLGKVLGTLLTGLYSDFFRFPSFEHRLAPDLVLIAAGISLTTAVLGTLGALRAVVRLAPAEAMRPPAPARYRRTLAERLGLHGLSRPLRMILRNMERRPLRSVFSTIGVAAAVAIVIMGNFFQDAIDAIVESKFNREMRGDVLLWLAEPERETVRLDIARLPAVLSAESGRDVPVRLVNGHRSERVVLQGMAAAPILQRVLDVDNRTYVPPAHGLLLTDRLADKLGLRSGQYVQVEVLEGRPRSLTVPVAGTVRDMMGLNAFIERRALNRLLGEGDVATRFTVSVQRGREAELLAAAMRMPRIAGAFSKAALWRNMEAVSARNVRVMSTILTLFAAVIAVGVVYNNARIALAERTRELASLRVLGFTRTEVSRLLLGEMAIGIALALPLGMWLGHGLVHVVVDLLKSDQFFFPVVILPRTYAWSVLAVVAAGAASALVVRRRIDRLDLVAVLKTRD